jgi:Flp pilus assembly protein TadD
VLGGDNEVTLELMNNLAVCLEFQGKFDEAEALYREAIATKERVIGRDHPDTLKTIGNLGGLLRRQGKFNEAERFNREA